MLTIKIQSAKHLATLAALLLALTGCGPPGPRALLEGKKLLESGKAQAAAERLKEATALMPTNALAFNYLGLACHEAGQSAEAERAYSRALSLNHELAEVRFNLGCLFLADNKLEKAKSEFIAFTLRRPNLPEGFLKLGTTQLRSHEPAAAERSFTEALHLSPANPEALTGIGIAKLQRNHALEASQYFGKALIEHPGYRPALINLAVVAQDQLRDKPLALRTYKQLLALKPPPENSDTIRTLVNNLEQDLNPHPVASPSSNLQAQTAASIREEAVPKKVVPAPLAQPAQTSRTDLASAKPAVPPASTNSARAPNPNANVRMGANNETLKPAPVTPSVPAPLDVEILPGEPVYKAGQDPAPATTSRQAKVTASAQESSTITSNRLAKRNLLQKINPARLFAGEGKPKTPTNALAGASPESPPASAQTNEGFNPPAAGLARYVYQNPKKQSPGNTAEAERFYAQGVKAYQSQMYPEAIQAYQKAIQVDPAFFNAYYNLALTSAESGDLPTALANYEKAIALRPTFLEGRYNFSLVLKQANYPMDAANELQKILASAPGDSRAHLALGNLYSQQLGNTRLARLHYLKVLEMDPNNPQAPNIHYWLNEHPR